VLLVFLALPELSVHQARLEAQAETDFLVSLARKVTWA